jgi:hypothetical protein
MNFERDDISIPQYPRQALRTPQITRTTMKKQPGDLVLETFNNPLPRKFKRQKQGGK